MLPELETAALVDRVLQGEDRAVAEALSRVEDTRPEALPSQRELLAELTERTPAHHRVVGITGPPGAGKSTLSAALIRHWTAEGSAVGMTAVDPSSHRSGGALLGDRARVLIPPGERVFIRSMAARDRLGGVAPATRAAVVVLRSVFPWTLVETVGVGQSEIEVESVADCVVLVLQPGAGDTLQFMKAGILEIPEVLVVHKWDLGQVAEQTHADLESILSLAAPAAEAWRAPVLGVSAMTGHGVRDLVEKIRAYCAHAERTGELAARRERARSAWALELMVERYGALGLERVGGREAAEQLARETAGTALDAFTALARRAGLEPLPERPAGSGPASRSH